MNLETESPAVEVPLYFPAGGNMLFGVLTEPKAGGDSAVIVLGGGMTPSTSTGRNRIFVTLARHVASLGYQAFRFDYHGVGESTGESTIRLDRPFVDDLGGAVKTLADRGIERYALIGSCFGARTALAAGGTLPAIRGAVLLAPPLRDFALSERRTEAWTLRDYLGAIVHPRRLVGGDERVTLHRYVRFIRSGALVAFRRMRALITRKSEEHPWVSRHFLEGVTSLIDRRIPMLFVYGTLDESYPDFEEARKGRLGRILDEAGASVEIAVLPGQVHGFTQTETQSEIIRIVGSWIHRTLGRTAPETSGSVPLSDP
jgi:pimeloyl-ACP methyl ester carboxylesterase